MSAPIPCRICGCIENQPGLCHAVVPSGLACYRPKNYPDWCSSCGTWDKELRQKHPLVPLEALAAEYRARQADAAADKRGQSVPGAYALRVHAVLMRRKGKQILLDAGLVKLEPAAPIKERDLPLCPQ